MTDLGLPVLFALFLWWFSTGLVLMLDGLPRPATKLTLVIATGIGLAALVGVAWAARSESVWAAYAAFVFAIVVWGWQELAFLTGWITGPRRQGCDAGCGGFAHFVHAVAAILYHELAILAAGIAIVAASWDAPNQTGTWTFLVLWGMRISAKLNLFLGVRNTGEEMLPAHLHYLRSYFARRPMNLLFPVSVTVATVLATLIVVRALDPHETPATSAGLMLAAALLGLAIIEHWVMVLPVRVSALWDWATRAHAQDAGELPAADRLPKVDAVTPRSY